MITNSLLAGSLYAHVERSCREESFSIVRYGDRLIARQLALRSSRSFGRADENCHQRYSVGSKSVCRSYQSLGNDTSNRTVPDQTDAEHSHRTAGAAGGADTNKRRRTQVRLPPLNPANKTGAGKGGGGCLWC
jgi:hypothetical protein